MLPLALPLAPVVGSGAAVSAVTFIAGSSLALASDVFGFRRSTPALPPLTGLEGEATLAEKLADYLAGARVPVGFPLPPPRPDLSWAAAAAMGVWGGLRSALAQLWGRAAGPPRTVPVKWSTLEGQWQQVTAGTVLSGVYGLRQTGSGVSCSGVPWTVDRQDTGAIASVAIKSWKYVIQYGIIQAGSCAFNNQKAVYLNASLSIFYVRNSDNQTANTAWRAINGPAPATGPGTLAITPLLDGVLLNGTPVKAPTTDVPWLGTTGLAEASAVGNLPLTPSLQSQAEIQAEMLQGEDVTPTTASTTAVTVGSEAPMPPPLVPLVPALPGVQQINNSGALVPAALPKLAPTAEEAHFPVPGGAAVGSIATAPQATLAGIAAEVGRIESKLNRLLNPNVSGDASDLLQLLWQGIQALINSLTDNRPGGQYELSSPCVLDSNDERVVYTAEFPETEDNTAAVLARLDALAALLQIHKDLKQPICHQTPAVGQPVQVQFVQIE